jgi:hypothetical protein
MVQSATVFDLAPAMPPDASPFPLAQTVPTDNTARHTDNTAKFFFFMITPYILFFDLPLLATSRFE